MLLHKHPDNLKLNKLSDFEDLQQGNKPLPCGEQFPACLHLLHSLLDLEQKERGISLLWGEYGIRFPCSFDIQTAAYQLSVGSHDTLEEIKGDHGFIELMK